MQPVDDSSQLVEAICAAFAHAARVDERAASSAHAAVQSLLAPLVASAIAGRRAAHVAHELRNPLAVIATSASILAGRAGADERVRKHLARIDAQVKIASSLALELLDAGSPRPLAIEATPVAELVRGSIEQSSLPQSVTIELRLDAESERSRVAVDRRRTTQILLNLLRNAHTAAGDAARITLAIARDGPHLVISVQDDGPGLAPGALVALFSEGSTRSADGHGIGLALSRAWARAQGGELSLASSERGARFELRCPVTKEPA